MFLKGEGSEREERESCQVDECLKCGALQLQHYLGLMFELTDRYIVSI